MCWRIFRYIGHLFHIRYRQGHGIHSPFLFEFINGVLFNSKEVKLPPEILAWHRGLRSRHQFVKRSSVSLKYGKLLYRIARWFRPEMIIELGTGMGVSTVYLASGSPGTPLHTIEKDRERALVASGMIAESWPGTVTIHMGEMEEELDKLLPGIPPRFLAFVDGNHRYAPTLVYVRKLIQRAGEEALIVMDDIYWSRGMQRAWREVTAWPEVRISVDLFHMGILILRKDLEKREIKIKF